MMPVTILRVSEEVPAVYVPVDALWCRGQRLDDQVPSRPCASRQLGDRGGRDTVFRREPQRREQAGSDLPGLDAERAQSAEATCSRAIELPGIIGPGPRLRAGLIAC
jgi:hypothetical protein